MARFQAASLGISPFLNRRGDVQGLVAFSWVGGPLYAEATGPATLLVAQQVTDADNGTIPGWVDPDVNPGPYVITPAGGAPVAFDVWPSAASVAELAADAADAAAAGNSRLQTADVGTFPSFLTVAIAATTTTVVVTGKLAFNSTVKFTGLRAGVNVVVEVEQDTAGGWAPLLPQLRGGQFVPNPAPRSESAVLLVCPDGSSLYAIGAASATSTAITDLSSSTVTGV